MIRAVLIDVDNTLLDFDACSKKAIAQAAALHGVDWNPEDYAVFKAVNNRMWQALERGALTREALYRTRFAEIFARLEIDADGPAFEQDYVRFLYDSCEVIDGAREALSYLSSKYPLYVASNALCDEQKNRLSRAGLIAYFRALFTSERVGAVKPEALFFRRCLEGIARDIPGIGASEVLMLGDSESADIAGAQAFGFKTCWYNPDARPATTQPDSEIRTLEAVKALL